MAIEPIDDEIEVGDPLHVQHHIDLAHAANEFETRITELEEAPSGGGSVRASAYGTWTTSEDAPTGDDPETVFIFDAGGGAYAIAFAPIDSSGADFTELLVNLPGDVRVEIVEVADPSNRLTIKIGDPFLAAGGYLAANGTLNGSSGTISSAPTDIMAFFEYFPAADSESPSTPGLSEVLAEDNSASTAIVLIVDTIRTTMDIGSFVAEDTEAELATGGTVDSLFAQSINDPDAQRRIDVFPDKIRAEQSTLTDTFRGEITFDEMTSDRSYSFPDKDGEVALITEGEAYLTSSDVVSTISETKLAKIQFIPNGGTVSGTPDEYTLIVELAP